LLDEAIRQDRFDLASSMVEAAKAAAVKSRDPNLRKDVEAMADRIQKARASYKKVSAALARLKEKPTDPDANLLAGKYHCFLKLDWKTGLPMLALGGDEVLKKIAELDLAEPKESEAQASVGDAWWDYAEKADANAKIAVQQRAKYWYELAVPGLSGLAKGKLEKRLRQIVDVSAVAHAAKETSSKWQDVLSHVDIDKDRVTGTWQVTKKMIAGDPKAGMSQMMLPVRVEGGYDLSLAFTRLGGNEAVDVFLPVGASRCNLAFSGFAGRVHCMHLIDGRDGLKEDANMTTVRPGTLVNGRRYQVLISVRVKGEAASVEVFLDGNPCIRWNGKQSSLSLPNFGFIAAPDEKRPCLGAGLVPVRFEAIKIRAVSGKVSFVR